MGRFVQVIILILAMIVTRTIADWIYRRLGTTDEAEQGLRSLGKS